MASRSLAEPAVLGRPPMQPATWMTVLEHYLPVFSSVYACRQPEIPPSFPAPVNEAQPWQYSLGWLIRQ